MFPFPTVYPPGLPFGESRRLLEALAGPRQPATFLTCGHRHRNRRYDYGRLVVTEVGSTKDYPGVWAGYKVFEGGIIQLVRRTATPRRHGLDRGDAPRCQRAVAPVVAGAAGGPLLHCRLAVAGPARRRQRADCRPTGYSGRLAAILASTAARRSWAAACRISACS